MEPEHGSQATLADLLERVLDKGIVLKLDLIIGVAGIPLIGISLQGAIAAIETMLEYGMMEAWDADIRARTRLREAQRRQLGLQPGEHTVLELYGSYHHARGIFRVWRPGRLILTGQRLLLVRPAPPRFFSRRRSPRSPASGAACTESLGGGRREIVSLALDDGTAGHALHLPARLCWRLACGNGSSGSASRSRRSPQADIERLDPGAVAEGQLWHRLAARGRPRAVEVRLGGAD